MTTAAPSQAHTGNGCLEADSQRVRAAELSEQVTQLQGQLEEERRARKQQGEGAELAHKALHDRQALLDQAYQRITAAEAASHEGQSKAQADIRSARQEAVDLKAQLDAATKNNSMLNQQLNAAAHKAEAESAVAAKHAQHQQEQKELEQLHASVAHMKVHLEVAQQSQRDAQADASALRQELQDRRLSVMKGELETAQAECAKASKGDGRLDTALKNSRNSHQQREAAFKARRAAEEREKGVSLQLRLAQGALGQGEADRQALISQHAAALEQQGQRVEALEKQLQKLQEVERGSRQEVERASRQGQHVEALQKQLQKLQEGEKSSRQEVEKLSRQLYLKRPQEMLSSQQHAIAQLQQKHQRQLGDLVQQLAAAEKRAKSSEAARKKTKAELQRQRNILTQFRKDVAYMDGQSRKADAQREKQLALPKPVSIEEEAKKALEHAKGLTDKERKDFARAVSLRWHPDKNAHMRQAAEEVYKALQQAGLSKFSAFVKPYFGDIFSGEGLRAALQARSFRQEVILMVSDHKRIDGFLQGARSLQLLGLNHILLLSLTESECKLIRNVVPEIGCGWTTFESPEDLEGVYDLWNMRYRTVARSIRLGYNVLLLDSDVIVFDDPYKYLKHPPFKDIVVINQEEGVLAPNGGVLYVQNAAPDGPAAFMFAEIVSRPLRWADDSWAHADRLSLHKTCMYADQDAYYDVLADVVSGYMLFPKSWYCLDEVVRQDPQWLKVFEEMEKRIRFFEAFKGVEHAAPNNWRNLTGGPTMSLMTVNLRMPNCRGWPEELGGQWYPTERGRFSKELLQQLQDDCPDCPMWPDAEDASNAAAADQVPTEKFAVMPHWLGISYWRRGRQGYWNAPLTGGVAQQVIGHTHYNPIGDTNIHKYTVPMSLGLYDWDLAKKAKGNALYTACASDSCSELKVLAFSPAVEGLLGSSASWQEFAFLLRGLAQLASLLGRAVAWPSLPCHTPWVNMGRQVVKPPLELGSMWLPRQSDAYQSLLGMCDLLNTTAMSHKYSFDSWDFASWHGLEILDGPSVKASVADRPQDLKKGKLVSIKGFGVFK
ncbi:hypothetical protein WJX82_008204 [Trebouxia sp. C0006]